MKRLLLILLFFGGVSIYPLMAQKVALKTNGAYWVTGTPNLSVEFGLANRSTLDFGGGYNPWNLNGLKNDNKKLVHWLGMLEYRYWFCQKFNGHFLGVHALGTQYNISGRELLIFGKGSKDYRYEGWGAGAGISYGYQLVLGRHWNIEGNIGIGYVRFGYDKYKCPKCSEKEGSPQSDYFGPTKCGISVVYAF